MMREAVSTVLLRELAALRRAVESYPDDDTIWRLPNGLPNAGGTLVLHVAGNLQHYVGAVLGESGYRRDRDAEFTRRDLPRAALLAELDTAADVVERTLGALPDAALAEPYPERVGGRAVATGDWLVHLASHLAYHLGQLDYHRRVVTGDARSIGALPVAALREHAPG
ncbi:MAG: DinB family protein [Gemmatimonadaceae bacterium]